jgi:hypothetical protein
MAALQASGKCSSASGGLRFPVRPDALPLSLIWNFENTSKMNPTCPSCLQPPTQDPPLFDNKRTLRYKSDKYGFKIQDQVQSL